MPKWLILEKSLPNPTFKQDLFDRLTEYELTGFTKSPKYFGYPLYIYPSKATLLLFQEKKWFKLWPELEK